MMILPTVTASAILLAGVVDDFRTRKFHNWLFLVCAACALIAVIVSAGLTGFNIAVLGFLAGIGVMLPLVLLGIVGAGDMKLLAAFGIAAGWNAVITVAVASLIWGALFGLLQVILKGQLGVVFGNMVAIVSLKERKSLPLHTVPFTAALLMGWLTHLVYQGVL